ncbi:hypothetical protein MMC28_010606 [Mycoblastus sanguinarius]|nr:hypothetical protein [Mycoblastus sanguinarius]
MSTNLPTISLNGRLSATPTTLFLRQAIINKIFDVHASAIDPNHIHSLDAYFNDWYEEQCEAAGGHVSFQAHEDILKIVALLQLDLDRAEIIAALQLQQANKEVLNASINLAARLWLTVSIGSLQQSLTPGNIIAWSDGKLSNTIHEALWLECQYNGPTKLERNFTAANLEKIAGIEVVWTSNLADHLCLKDDDTKVLLYHQVSFLELHKNSKTSPLPTDMVEETIRTLALLISSIDPKAQTWFRRKQKQLGLDPKASTYGPLNAAARQIGNFKYWRDRLVILKETFDDSEPHTLSLWWYDDRKKVQWYTFWIAALVLLLTVVFGMVQSVAGVVQAWAALRSIPVRPQI